MSLAKKKNNPERSQTSTVYLKPLVSLSSRPSAPPCLETTVVYTAPGHARLFRPQRTNNDTSHVPCQSNSFFNTGFSPQISIPVSVSVSCPNPIQSTSIQEGASSIPLTAIIKALPAHHQASHPTALAAHPPNAQSAPNPEPPL